MQIIPPHLHHIKSFLLLSTGILPVLLCSFNGPVQKNERSWDRTWSTSGLSALLTTLPRSLHLCTAAHKKQKNQNLPPRFQPLSSILGDQSKLSCAVASRCHESWICYWIKTLTLGGKLQNGLECPQPATSHGHRIPSCEGRKGHFQIVVAGTLKAFLQCKNSKSKIHAIMFPTSFPSKTNTTYCYLIPCFCNSPYPRSSCMKISTAMMPCGHLRAT